MPLALCQLAAAIVYAYTYSPSTSPRHVDKPFLLFIPSDAFVQIVDNCYFVPL